MDKYLEVPCVAFVTSMQFSYAACNTSKARITCCDIVAATL